MTAAAALQSFFEGFMGTTGKAYPETSVPDDVAYPYLTYQYRRSAFGDTPVSITVYLWFYTESEKVPTKRADDLYDLIGNGGKQIHCDDGVIWITRGTPFCIPVNDQTIKDVRGRYINLNLEYLTAR